MMRAIGRWIFALAVLFAAVSLASFVVDWAVFKLRGSPQSTVAVSQYMQVSLKGGKMEYDYLGTQNVPCAVALFPHESMDPCWNLRRNPTQWVNAGSIFIPLTMLSGKADELHSRKHAEVMKFPPVPGRDFAIRENGCILPAGHHSSFS